MRRQSILIEEEPRSESSISKLDASSQDGATNKACKHCGLSIPAKLLSNGFCCSGCAAVFEFLQSEGLERFYDLRPVAGPPVGDAPAATKHDWLDDLEARSVHADGTVRLVLDVQGVRCAACVWVLEELWRRTSGGILCRIDPTLGRVKLGYGVGSCDVSGFLSRAAALGYSMAPASKASRRIERGLLVRVGVCAALAGNAMMLGLSGYLGLDAAGGSLLDLFRSVSFGLATIAVVVGGSVFFKAAWAGLRQTVLHLDLPISAGILLAYGGSTFGLLTGGLVYFDTVTVFVALMLVGRYLQVRSVAKNRDLLLADDGAEHLRVRRIVLDVVQRVPVRQVEVGDVLWLSPGDLLPVRARLLSDSVDFSSEWINGESAPRRYIVGDELPAGSFHADDCAVRLESSERFADSAVAELLRSSHETSNETPFWTRLNRIYVVLVLGIAAIGGGLWLWIDPSRAIPVAVSVLVVTCPCALGIATPLASFLTMGRLRQAGVFVRNERIFLNALAVRKVVFDKTGTLTWGGQTANWLAPNVAGGEPWGIPSASDLQVLSTLARSSSHPASLAIASLLAREGIECGLRTDLTVFVEPGRGLRAVDGGSEYRLGSAGFALRPQGEQSESKGAENEIPSTPGSSSVTFARDGQRLCGFGLSERYREGSRSEIAALTARGIEVYLFSGDSTDRVLEAALTLGVAEDHARGDLSPNEKGELVAALNQSDTLMVGDGLNDAPAFESSLAAGTPSIDRPVMPSRSDFFYAGSHGGAVLSLLEASSRMRRVVTRNLWAAGIYNVGAVGLCLMGVMSPVLCAILMPLSSIALVTHTVTSIRPTQPGAAR